MQHFVLTAPTMRPCEPVSKRRHKTPMLNSLSGEKFRVEGVLPLACEFGTELIVLPLDDNGIPRNQRRTAGYCQTAGGNDSEAEGCLTKSSTWIPS